MPKLVLFLDNPTIATGYASTCRLTAKEMAKRGWEIYAVSFNGGHQADTIQEWYGIKILPNHALKRNAHSNYGDAETVVQIFNEINPDILFFHNDSYRYSYIESLPKEILDRSVFWLPFEGDYPDAQGLRLFNKCAATRFVTNHALSIHRDQMNGKDIGAVPHAIDLDNFTIIDKRQAKRDTNLGIENKFVVSRVDRHQPRKYWDLTLKAFAKFAQGKDDVFFLAKCNPRDLVMYNEQTKNGIDLEVIAAELGITSKIKFSDFFFNGPFMARAFYNPADVFLTTTSGEGFGLTPVEAMACGVPVICPDTPVLPEVVAEGGIFCSLKGKEWYDPMKVFHNIVDVDEVVVKLEWAYQDWKNGGQQLAQIGKKGREIVERKYSPTAVYNEWDKTFRRVAEQRDLVSIVTVLFNVAGDAQLTGEDGIGRFRDSIEKYVHHPYEWIIVDNGSPAKEQTRAWLETVAKANPRIKPVFSDANLGFAGGCNLGISHAKGDAVILANPDSEALDPKKLNLPNDFVRMMLDKTRADPYIGIIGMELNKRDDILQGATFPYFCNVLITRACLDACKLGENQWLDEKFWPAYYEDCDYTLRAMGKGFRIVSQNVPFWHKSGGTNKYAIEGGAKGPYVKLMRDGLEQIAAAKPDMADFNRKRGEIETNGMQGLIHGNIAHLQNKWGVEARQKIKVVWDTHIGASVGFSQIAEGLIPELHKLGFDVYVNDWSNSANVEDPLIRKLIEKTRKAAEETDDLDSAIHIVCWLMETFMDVDADFKVGISFCESTRVRPQYLNLCNSMDRILTFSDFCRGVQKNSGFTSPIHVIPPGVHPIFLNHFERKKKKDMFTFLNVGVAQDRKDTRRLVEAFCETFPKDRDELPDCEPGFPLKPRQVELVLKSNNFGELNWVHQDGFSNRANIRTIFTGWDKRAQRSDFTMQEMYDLYADADCLVHPSHGEGIGMPILEGAATGLPVIFTNWSSPAEYMNETNSYPLSLGPNGTDFVDAYVGHGGRPGENGKWASMHVGHLKHLMRQVIRHPEDAREKGKRAAAHIKQSFNWQESARQLIPLIFEWDAERKRKTGKSSFDPLTFSMPKLDPIKKGDRVLIDIVTRDRHSYLCGLLTSLLSQTFGEWDVIIQCDDADETMPSDHQIMHLMHRCMHEGHGWRIIRSHRQGPHIAHDRTLQMAKDDPNYKYKLICRIDDDIYVRPDYLEKLYANFLADEKCEIGAVSGIYLDPKRSEPEQTAPAGWETDINYAGKIDHNVPWPYICAYPKGTKPRTVEHLYSSFMYRVEIATAIGGYCRRYSQIGHREESDFSYRFHLAGAKLLIEPQALGFHFSAPGGGIRSNNIVDRHKLAESDHRIYARRLARWKKRSEMRKRQDAEVAKGLHLVAPAAKPKTKVALVINGDKDLDKLSAAVARFNGYDEIYVNCTNDAAKEALGGKLNVKMVATSLDETALLTKAILADGDHEFIMTVTDSMYFSGDPLSVISDQYDDYVFEAYRSYIPGRVLNGKFVEDKSVGQTIGPEVRNICVITRRRKDAKPSLERTYYSDIMIIEDEKIIPIDGKSVMGHELLVVSEIPKKNWTKICTYQYPEGKLDQPRKAEVISDERLVSIIIPTAGRKQLLKNCIDSIYSHTTTPFEIIIVDNDSNDGTAQYLEAEMKIRPQIKHFRQATNLGYQKAVNIGMGKARGEFILLFNDDAWVQGRETDGRDWLQTLIDELKANPKLGLVGPHGCESPALGSRILFFWCVMFRRSLYDQIGPLDDVTFRNYGGDDDYCERCRAAGHEIKEKWVNLRHLMNQVPDNVKKPELEESVLKLRAKYKK